MNKLLIICAVVAFVLAASGQAQALEPTVWVDDDMTIELAFEIYRDEYEGSLGFWEFMEKCIDWEINGGIGKVADGGSVYVMEGTYIENVVIDKSITLEAFSSPIIDGEGTLTNPAIHVQAANVKVDGFVIQNFIATGADQAGDIGAILVEGDNAKIWNNIVRNITCTGTEGDCPAGLGIDVSANDVEVKGNEVYDINSIGIRVRARFSQPGIQMTNVKLEDNTVHDTGNSGILVVGYVTGIEIVGNEIYDSLAPTPYSLLMVPFSTHAPSDVLIGDNTIYNGYGNICLGGVTNITITGNTIYGAIPHYSDPENIKGKNIYIRDWGNVLTTNVTITNNKITDADGYGVFFRYDGSGDPSAMVTTTKVNDNNISGNTNGIENPIGTTLLDATHNWWGDASGPSGAGPGTGDAVSANVDFFQWCLDIDCSDFEPPYGEKAVVMVDDDWTGLSGGTIVYGSEIGLNAFATIQEGIDAVDEGGTVNVLAGTYIEDLVINKNDLEIVAVGTTIKGVATELWDKWPFANPNIDLQANGVKISGFTIQSPDVPDGHYSSGIVLTGTDIEICDNTFVSNAAGDGGCVVIQTYRDNVTGYESDISGLNIHDNDFGGTAADGYVGVFINHTNVGAGAVTVKNNTLSDRVAQGVVTERSNTLIQDNIISNSDVAGYSRGIIVMDWDVRDQDSVTMSDNTITGCQYGIRIGTTGQTLTNISVTGNTLQDNDVGVHVRASAGGVVVNNNNITGNTTYGAQNTDAGIPYVPCDPLDPNDPNSPCDPNGLPAVEEVPPGVLDATLNWWGEVRGPHHPTANPHGTGNEVSDNVEFVPWLDASYPDGQLYTNVFIDDNRNGAYDAGEPIFYIIQNAINAALEGDIIIVGAGTYYENLVIDKSGITLKSTKGRDKTTLSHQSSSEVGVDFGAGADYCVLGGEAGHGFTMVKDSVGFLIQLTNAPSSVEISHNTIDTVGDPSQGISDANGTTDLTINRNIFPMDEGDIAIGLWGPIANLSVCGNTFSGPTNGNSTSVKFAEIDVNGATISKNTITGATASIELGTDLVTGITFSNNFFSETQGAILVQEPVEDPGKVLYDLTVTRNEFATSSLDSYGFLILFTVEVNDVDYDTVHVNENIFNVGSGNSIEVVSNDATGTPTDLDATNNWWGNPTGPSGEGSGSGDDVSENVDYDPWWVCGDTVNPCPIGDLNRDDQVDFADFAIFADNWLESTTPCTTP